MNAPRARVLLVDDDPEDQMIVRRILRRVRGLEYEIDVLSSFEEAVLAIDKRAHDLYLFDHARERALAVRSLRASEERYALALAGSNDGIWDWDLERDEVHLSPRWWALMGVENPPPNPARLDVWTERVHAADQEELRRAFSEHIEDLAEHFECEFRMRHEDGNHAWMLARGVGVRAPDGAVRRMAGSLTDVSERRYAQERLISHVSHELRTPLTAIYQFVTNLRDGIAGGVNALQDELLAASVRNIEELDRMVTGLVEATRARSDAFSLDRQPVMPADLVHEVYASHASIASRSGVELGYDLADELPLVYGDPSRLRQVLVNLVGNAIKFMPPEGKIVMRVSVDPRDRTLCS